MEIIKCNTCGEDRNENDYGVKYYKSKKTGIVTQYRNKKCKYCRRAKEIENDLGIIPGSKKYCHGCMKYKPFDNFRPYKMKGKMGYAHDNYCHECKDKGLVERKRHNDNASEGAKDFDTTKFHCGFIGNASYKHICEVYKIRKSRKMLKEKTYKQMREG